MLGQGFLPLKYTIEDHPSGVCIMAEPYSLWVKIHRLQTLDRNWINNYLLRCKEDFLKNHAKQYEKYRII